MGCFCPDWYAHQRRLGLANEYQGRLRSVSEGQCQLPIQENAKLLSPVLAYPRIMLNPKHKRWWLVFPGCTQ